MIKAFEEIYKRHGESIRVLHMHKNEDEFICITLYTNEDESAKLYVFDQKGKLVSVSGEE